VPARPVKGVAFDEAVLDAGGRQLGMDLAADTALADAGPAADEQDLTPHTCSGLNHQRVRVTPSDALGITIDATVSGFSNLKVEGHVDHEHGVSSRSALPVTPLDVS
jgi:hypothetical protein